VSVRQLRRRGRGTVERRSDVTAARQRELEGEEWAADLERRGVALAECNPAPLPPPPADGRCPRVSEWRSSCKSRACPVCGPSWARNQRTKIGHNLEHYGGKVATIAITGPGADVLPWDDDHCGRRNRGPNHVHSGRRGCRVQQRPLREWCETLGWRWKKLREAAQLATRKAAGEPVVILERVWEPQKRGVPHLHLVVPYGTPRERAVADAFRDALVELVRPTDSKHDQTRMPRAQAYGFGRVQPKLKAIEGHLAARYLANYLAGRSGKKSSIRENIADPRLPKSLLWETPILSSVSESPRMVAWRERRGITLGTGITMRTLRRMRHLSACFKGVCDFYPRWSGLEEAVVVAAVFRETAPTRAGPLGNFAAALDYARTIDRRVNAERGWPSEYNPEARRVEMPESLCRELARIAFDVTRAPQAVAA
jgi:hypothetical protein